MSLEKGQSDVEARYAAELQILEEAAISMYDEAVIASDEKYPSIKGLTQNGFLKLDEYIEAWSEVHYKKNERMADINAHWVGQREMAILGPEELGRGERIGADNLQQCVAIVIDGKDKDGQRMVAIAHVDKYTKAESVENALNVFNIGPETEIKLYGGRSAFQEEISEENIRVAEHIVREAKSKGAKVDQSQLRNPNASPNIVYDPEKGEILMGRLPIKGHTTQEIRLMSRRAQNAHMAHDYQDRAVPRRDSAIRTIDLDNPQRVGLSDLERCVLLDKYAKGECESSLSTLNRLTDIRNPGQLSEYCAMELKPLGEGVKHSLSVSAGYNIKLNHIYKGSERVRALCEKVASEGATPPYVGDVRRLLPDYSIRAADCIRRAVEVRDRGGSHVQTAATNSRGQELGRK